MHTFLRTFATFSLRLRNYTFARSFDRQVRLKTLPEIYAHFSIQILYLSRFYDHISVLIFFSEMTTVFLIFYKVSDQEQKKKQTKKHSIHKVVIDSKREHNHGAEDDRKLDWHGFRTNCKRKAESDPCDMFGNLRRQQINYILSC